ncbi:hypothetical protein K1T71_011936 [Dendrolimus kikuchii]|uniref:Uncharacterized protein n=1 Tax=Dendrolimus kikuchii TaxID=765133 RepID=A0ACC1CMU7_9NEOP|nr:hypothetical protein K1T71_011936 [Dendrolimus kikuchii]
MKFSYQSPYSTYFYYSISKSSRLDTLFSKCCCCIPLRTGCFVLGYLALISNCIRILSILGFALYVMFNQTDEEYVNHFEIFIYELSAKSLYILVVVLLISLAWFAVNIAVLVGLHKRRPGPIKMYVGFASLRLILMLIGFIILVAGGETTINNFIYQSIDIGLTAYFVLVYYVYSIQLELEQAQRRPHPAPNAEFITYDCLVYPTTLSEKHLIN